MVDIGTGFYVEKVRPHLLSSFSVKFGANCLFSGFFLQTLPEAIEYKDKKAKYVMQNAQQIENLLDQKAKNLQQVDLVLQHKLEAQQARQRVAQ